jgi:hypothetical protein
LEPKGSWLNLNNYGLSDDKCLSFYIFGESVWLGEMSLKFGKEFYFKRFPEIKI